jgi:serine protease
VRLALARISTALAIAGVSALGASASAGPQSATGKPAVKSAVKPAPKVLHTVQDVVHGPRDTTTGGGDPGNMYYHGGPVLIQPKIYLIFWHWRSAKDPAAQRLVAFFKGVGGSGWQGVTTQYFQGNKANRKFIQNPAGQLRGVWFDPTAIHDNLSDLEIAQAAARGVAHFGTKPDSNALYFVATPFDANTTGFNRGDYCAWHDFTASSTYPSVIPGIAFANQPYVPKAGANCGAHFVNSGASGYYDGMTMAAGHEYVEAITDPRVTIGPQKAWADVTGEENGDKCAYVTIGPGKMHNLTLPTGTFAVQSSWSNKANGGLGACAG